MNLKRSYSLFSVLLMLIIGSTHLNAQEGQEDPADTLARSVRNLKDEMEVLKRLEITGYVQPQYQVIDSAGAPSFAGGDFINGTSPYYSRFMMRRGRFKFTYSFENVKLMVNIDATEKGLAMRETYAQISSRNGIFRFITGLLQDQFGFELTQSSSSRETPERARFNQTLFPTERDMGAFGSIIMPKSSKLYGLKLDLAVMNGSAGVAPEFDSHKDFTGRLQYTKTTTNEKVSFAVGTSCYYGGYRIGKVKDYVSTTLANGDKGFDFAADTANYNRVARRLYIGADAQFTFDWKPGITILRGEYVQGEHPGTSSSMRAIAALPTSAIYHREFNAAYFYFIQNIGQSKFQVVAKYDWWDPNVKLSGTQIGKSGTNTKVADIRFDTYVFGVTYRFNTYLKLMVFYDLVKNEKTLVTGYKNDIKDNVLTIRMQIRY